VQDSFDRSRRVGAGPLAVHRSTRSACAFEYAPVSADGATARSSGSSIGPGVGSPTALRRLVSPLGSPVPLPRAPYAVHDPPPPPLRAGLLALSRRWPLRPLVKVLAWWLRPMIESVVGEASKACPAVARG
jgi:hypothetical protein